jgi:hypothetical protein
MNGLQMRQRLLFTMVLLVPTLLVLLGLGWNA